MKTKEEYRILFKQWGQKIKMTAFVEEVGIAKSTYSLFINGSDGVLSAKKLNNLENCITNYFEYQYKQINNNK